MQLPASVFGAQIRDPKGALYHGGALGYALLAYALGFAGLFSGSFFLNVLATLLLAHGMTIAAYLVHECAHNTVFKSMAQNGRLGRFLTWICGASYGAFEDIRYKHFRHHADVDDVVWFDYARFFQEHPLCLRATQVLEWFYIPAHDLIMHFIMVFTSFVFGDDPKDVIPLGPQLRIFHQYRVSRIVEDEDEGGSDLGSEPWGRSFLEAAREGRVPGGNAASFLTSF